MMVECREEDSMATVTKPITAEEFIEMPEPPDGSKQELVRGEIVMLPPPGFQHGEVQVNVATLLKPHVRAHRLGRITVESGVVIERDPDTVRGPDVAFWSVERLPFDQCPQGYPEVAPDLCVEVLSPSRRLRDIREKIQEYFTRGVRMVWIVDPHNRTISVYRSADEGRLLHETATLSGEEVLPGFTCRVAEFFD
jgi:Uma2 family endonuclease